jgi:hypothetical protein
VTDNIFAFALSLAGWSLALREYVAGRRNDWPLFAVGTAAALVVVVLAAWDLAADLGRRGDLASAFAAVAFLTWLTVVGWRYIRPSSWP